MPHYKHLESIEVKAVFSDCGRYRYLLSIKDQTVVSGHTLAIVMQNPSVADEGRADKSVQFLERYFFRKRPALLPQINELHVVNQFAFVQTKEFRGSEIHIGPENDQYLQQILTLSDYVLLAWGKRNPYQERKASILGMLIGRKANTIFEAGIHPSRGRYQDYIRAFTPSL